MKFLYSIKKGQNSKLLCFNKIWKQKD